MVKNSWELMLFLWNIPVCLNSYTFSCFKGWILPISATEIRHNFQCKKIQICLKRSNEGVLNFRWQAGNEIYTIFLLLRVEFWKLKWEHGVGDNRFKGKSSLKCWMNASRFKILWILFLNRLIFPQKLINRISIRFKSW